MMSIRCLVAAFVAVAVTRTEAFTGTLCVQEPVWRDSFCGYIYNCMGPNNRLNSLVASQDAVDEAAFGLMEPTNVTTLDFLYTELKKYKGWFEHFDDALAAYMATPEYAQESVSDSVSDFTRKYKNTLLRLLTELDQTVTKMSEQDSGAGEDVVINGGDGIKNLEVIKAETNYVTSSLGKVLELWADNCDLCIGQRRRRRSRLTKACRGKKRCARRWGKKGKGRGRKNRGRKGRKNNRRTRKDKSQ